MRKLVYATIFTILLSVGFVTASASVSSATNSHGQQKITLCHATHSEKNPYVEITVAVPSVQFNGHDTHQDNEDIIPPFSGYPGKNWTTTGQKIWSNGCKVTKATTTTTAKATTTTTAAPTTTTTVAPTTTTTTAPRTTTTLCPPKTTTTTAAPETTTTTVAPTTTSTSVAPTTSTTVAPSTTTSSTSTTLAPGTSTSTTSAPPTTEIGKPSSLARTGFEMVAWTFLATLCLVLGQVFLIWSGRRKHRHMR